ncbi:MAG: DUF4474 domain-containing protein [Clostridia bacterium]|nr:DUF4474 domain-containing protein [Clostridia bacterium]
MKKTVLKAISVFFVLIFAFSYVAVAHAVATPTDPVPEDATHALVLESEGLTVAIGRTIKMTAKVTNVAQQPRIVWSTSDSSVATVNEDGVVRGIEPGNATITASATVDGETLRGDFVINVTKNSNFVRDLLEKQQILSYQYSYIDDYYYTNDKESWQYNFGFGKIYDIASPYILLEYDYIRVFFTYENKDWMLQMWKGQYGLIFYGGEIGIYNREHSEDGVNDWTMYNCPAEEDWLMMEMSLYHQDLQGNYVREFTREYDKYWWCTGFKNGHLREQEPADELRLVGRITFKDEKMAQIVADGLKECRLKESKRNDSVGVDQYCMDGKDVYFCWQNISEAESTMAIKVVGGTVSAMWLMPLWIYIIPFVGAFSLLALLVSAVL